MIPTKTRTGGVALLLLSSAVVVTSQPDVAGGSLSALHASQTNNQVQAAFEALLMRVKQSDPSVSFLQLRRLYAESDSYKPYRDDAEDSMTAAAGAKQYETALRIAQEILARDYMNIEAHFAGAVSCNAQGDMACAAHHAYVARGLIESILASGDGKAPATAFVVVKVPEEYALLRMLQMERLSQALIRSDDGHAYDVLTVRDRRSAQESRIYFNVDIAMAATARVFGLK
jgi:Domain of unknown function (DUF4919)